MKRQSSIKAANVQIEVIVQDCFDQTSELSKQSGDSAITAETWQTWFERWLAILQPHLPPALNYELSLRLTDDTEIQALNFQYRQQNKPTDVLAFAALEVDFPQPVEMRSLLPLYLGDIVISVDTARRQAPLQGHTLQTELAWLAAHGLLHLLGWDHPDEDSLLQMLNQQTIMLQNAGININTDFLRQEG